MNLHVDPIADILQSRTRYVPQNTAGQRDRLDAAAAKLTADLIQGGAVRGTFYFTIGAGEIHLYAPREVMKFAQDKGLTCDFVVDWHELKSNIADSAPNASQRLRSEPASVTPPSVDAGSTLSEAEASAS